MIDFSISIEMAFAEGGPSFSDRVRAAADAGFSAVEIWYWRDRDLNDLKKVLTQTETRLASLCVETWRDKCNLGDPAEHEEFLKRVSTSAQAAVEFGRPKLVLLGGDAISSSSRPQQYDAMVDVLRRASDLVTPTGLELVIEVVNRQFEGPHALLDNSATALQILRRVSRPNVKYLYDRYHAIVNGEALGWAVDGNVDLLGHYQAADVPGRHEFGTGTVDWVSEFRWLVESGYQGLVGIEGTPLESSASLYRDACQLLRRARTSDVAPHSSATVSNSGW